MTTFGLSRTLPHPSKDPNLRILITDDLDPENPLVDHPVMVWCYHRDYALGTPAMASVREVAESLPEGTSIADHLHTDEGARVIMPVYLHDHSGLSVSVGAPGASPTTDGWDTSMVGYAYIPAEHRDAGWGTDPLSLDDEAQIIRDAVTQYDHYLGGRTYMARVQARTLVHTTREIHHADGLVTHEYTITHEWNDDPREDPLTHLYGWENDIDTIVVDEYTPATATN